MGLLFPLYFLGALAVGVPLYLHLKRQPPQERVEFGSLMFLEPTRTVKVKRRKEWENVLLLLLRCAALLLLVLAFTRPFLTGETEGGSGNAKRTVMLVDVSASMAASGVKDEARGVLRKKLEEVADRGGVDVWVFDDEVRAAVETEAWDGWGESERVEKAMELIDDEWRGSGGTAVGGALAAAAEALGGEGRVVLVSDLVDSAGGGGIAGLNWPMGAELELLAVGEPGAGAGAEWVAEGEDGTPRVRVSNGAGAEEVVFELSWEGMDEKTVVTVPPGKGRVVELSGGGERLEVVREEGEPMILYYAAPVVRETVVWVAGGNVDDRGSGDGVYFLARALGGDDRRTFLFSDDLEEADVLVVAEGPGVDEKSVAEAVRGGALALVVAQAGTEELLRELAGDGLSIREGEVEDYVLFEGIEFDHPMMGVFRGEGMRDFSKVRTWRYREIELPEGEPGERVEVLARYDRGDMALLEIEAGKGRAVVFASGWAPAEGQLALSTKFVPLVYSILEAGGALRRESGALKRVGEVLSLAEGAGVGGTEVTGPDEVVSDIEPGAAFRFGKAGRYLVEQGEGKVEELVANLPAAELAGGALDLGQLEAAGVRIWDGRSRAEAAVEGEISVEEAEAGEIEREQQFWRWIVVGIFVVLIVETLLSGKRAGGRREEEFTGNAEVNV